MLVLDTNVYIDASQDSDRAKLITSIVDDIGDAVGLHSVVAAELVAGGSSLGGRSEFVQRLMRVAKGVVTPIHDDWTFAGNALRLLGADAVTTRRSFWNDLLIATSCARGGVTLLTNNQADFARIRRTIPVDILALPN
ncbi:MAG: type II toxin-antitoxin system VapC family toxin [Gemmatimonadota bacterium]